MLRQESEALRLPITEQPSECRKGVAKPQLKGFRICERLQLRAQKKREPVNHIARQRSGRFPPPREDHGKRIQCARCRARSKITSKQRANAQQEDIQGLPNRCPRRVAVPLRGLRSARVGHFLRRFRFG